MSSEIRLAFAHPSERSEATAARGALDRISLRDHIVEVEIGAFQAERGTTQRICFNIVVEVRPLTDPIDDDVDRILSYDRVTEAIAFELAAERLNLLETLADRVAERILLEPQAVRAFVRIEKLDRGPGALGVEIVRGKDAVHHDVTEEERPHATDTRRRRTLALGCAGLVRVGAGCGGKIGFGGSQSAKNYPTSTAMGFNDREVGRSAVDPVWSDDRRRDHVRRTPRAAVAPVAAASGRCSTRLRRQHRRA